VRCGLNDLVGVDILSPEASLFPNATPKPIRILEISQFQNYVRVVLRKFYSILIQPRLQKILDQTVTARGVKVSMKITALGPDRFCCSQPARPQGQAGHAEYPSGSWGRTARAATPSARTGAEVALCVHLRKGRALQHRRLRSHDRAGRGRGQARVQGTPTHAAARLRLCASQQGSRHARAASLPWTPQHSAHGEIY
jgi:hypothetical protein